MSSFAELGVRAPVAEGLERHGIMSPFPIQGLVVPDALAGRDVLARSRTGSGKTLAFALPLVQRVEVSRRSPQALVLVPTRELAVQVGAETGAVGEPLGVRAAAVFGGVPLAKQAAEARSAHVVVATPGRLDDLVARRLLKLDRITILVLDEADRMLDMGFQPQVDRIVRRLSAARQTLLFSATLDERVQRLARAYTTDPVCHEIVHHDELKDAEHRFVRVRQEDKVDRLIEVLGEGGRLTLVFVRTKRGADRLGLKLAQRGIAALVLHGDMTQGARQRTLDRFARGRPAVLVATDVAARGIHLDHITHVVNYDAPGTREEYVHRTGRTARAGRSGTAVTFVSLLQQHDVGLIARALDLDAEFRSAGMATPTPRTVYSSRRARRR
jgi:superfamily II DNA/RNA helicase